MATDTEKYQELSTLPYSSTELGAFHRFHAHNWDQDEQFQSGLRTITDSQTFPPSVSELLKMKQYYFSTRLGTQINLDNYLAWRKHLEKPSDDPNVPIFKRFDEYDFDNDIKFQKGLPSIIGQLIKDGKGALDKAALQKEMTKAKAFYYARFIELFDFPAYLTWKDMEKSQAGPACPYAHLWQDKGKGSGNELADDAQKFLTTTSPVSTGAMQIHVHSPATKNVWTGHRLAKMSEAIAAAESQGSVTSVLWTVNSGSSSQTHRDPESIIVSRDEKWFCGGVVTSGSSESQKTQDPSKDRELLRQYFSLLLQLDSLIGERQKTVVTVIDGMVSLSAAYLAFGPGAQRVITENAALSFTPLESVQSALNELENPFAGLQLLAHIQSHAKADTSARPLPKGVSHYLAFCPNYVLRGPDLRKLGLADFFVSSSKKKDVEEAVLSVAGCPPPHTVQAIRMALNAEITYPGPAKIDVWRTEIQECFSDATSLSEIVKRLEKYDNNWSKSIRTYIASLEPVYAKLLFAAVSMASDLTSFQDRARLEYRLTQHYKEHTAKEQKTDIDNLDAFFEPIENEEAQLFTFPFTDWVKEHDDKDEFNLNDKTQQSEDPTKACPYLHPKSGDINGAVPLDHPAIPGVDFSDLEAAKACPYLSAKKDEASKPNAIGTVPADHPTIPGVDFSNPEAAKACPFLAVNRTEEVDKPTTGSISSSDHPAISGVDFSDPNAVKACPFLSAQNAKDGGVQ
ncbi:hypothetical protein EDD11_005783 [Mortierella claussenii]|nr:hypothetical protein EDD11_005783 [Mortierella claussenii]